MGLIVSELQARVTADTGQAERAFENVDKAQNRIADSARRTGDAVEQEGRKLEDSAHKADTAWTQFSNNLGKISSKLIMLGSGLSVAVTAPIIGLGKEALETARKFDSLDRGLSAVMHGSEQARQEFTKLREVAKLPGLGLEEAMQGSINLQAAGMSAEQARNSLMGFGNALATVGRGKADLDGIILALTQIQAKGKIMAQDINQIQERVPQIRQIMLKAFGTADTEILQQAKITANEFVDTVTGELMKLPKVTGGIQNDMENLSDTWKLTLREMGIALFPFVQTMSEKLVPAMQAVTDAFQAMTPHQKNWIVWGALAAAAVGPLVVGVGLLAGAIVNLTELFGLFGPVAETFSAAISGIALGPIALVLAAVGTLYLSWRNNWGGMRDALDSVFSSMGQTIERWINFVKRTWAEWTDSVTKLTRNWINNNQDLLIQFSVFWETFWTGIAAIVTSVFGVMRIGIDAALGAIRVLIGSVLKIMQGDWKGAWELIKTTTKETFDNIKTDTIDSLSSIQGQFKNYYDKMQGIVTEGNRRISNAAASNPIIPYTVNGMLSSHAKTNLKPLPEISLSEMNAHSGGMPGPLPPAGGNMFQSLSGIRNRISDVMTQSKRSKLTDEQRQQLSLTKELKDSYAELSALRRGESLAMSDEIGKYNLLNPAKVAELVRIKEQIKALKESTSERQRQIQAIADEQQRFHEAVKATEANIRDLRSGGKSNSLTDEFPNIAPKLIDYFNNLKQTQDHLKDVITQNNNFKQSLSDVKAQIESLLTGDGLSELKSQFHNLIPDTQLQKLNDANVQLKALQQLQSAMNKLELLQMSKREREAATAIGLDMWKGLTDEAKNNTLAIFDNIHAQEELAKSLEKANEQAQKRADALKDFNDTMNQRLLAAQANALGDTATGAWEQFLAGHAVLRDALNNGPTQEKTNAMKLFMDVFNKEKETKSILESANALQKFNDQMNESSKLASIRLQGRGDSVEAEWQRFLLHNKNLSRQFQNDTKASEDAFKEFKSVFDLNEEADRLESFQSKIGDMKRDFMSVSAIDPFEKFKISMTEIRNGEIFQPFTEDQLKDMFRYQQIINLANNMQDIFENAILNLKDGFNGFFNSIVQGFEKMLQQMAAKWLASQLVNLVLRLIGQAFNVTVPNLNAPGRAAGGPVMGGQAYIVGERGPELFVPQSNGRIENKIPAGNTYHFNFNIQTPNVESFRQSAGQLMTDAKRQADYYESKNVSRMNRGG